MKTGDENDIGLSILGTSGRRKLRQGKICINPLVRMQRVEEVELLTMLQIAHVMRVLLVS